MNEKKSGIAVPQILIPDEKINMKKWSTVACDQFVYDKAYWEEVEKLVGTSPSTLSMMLPEAYLGESDVKKRIDDTRDAMYDYIETGVLKELPEGFILVERTINDKPRLGLMVLLDLEEYEFESGLKPLIRPTEQTIKDRLPARMEIRMGAPVEMPHIIALIDDPNNTVIRPVYDMRSKLKCLYDFDLMQNGGHIRGYFINNEEMISNIIRSVSELDTHDGMKIAIGDGNHSLATAKEVWERAKTVLNEEELSVSPLRYALAEIVNLHDPALEIEGIHRAVKNVNPSLFLQKLVDLLNRRGLGGRLIFTRTNRFAGSNQFFGDHEKTVFFMSKQSIGRIEFTSLSDRLLLQDLQPALEQIVKETPGAYLEYIHGERELREISSEYETVCFKVPPIAKDDFMQTVIDCEVLPKKSFSLGEANEKRYYLESRLLIIPDPEQSEASDDLSGDASSGPLEGDPAFEPEEISSDPE